MVVLHDAEVAAPSKFLTEVLTSPPYLLRVDGNSDALKFVRRLGIALVEEAMQLPLAHRSAYEAMML